MKRKSYRIYFFVGLALCVLFSLSETATDQLRYGAVRSVQPAWYALRCLKSSFVGVALWASPGCGKTDAQEVEKLRQENHVLRLQMAKVKEWLASERHIQERVELLRELSSAHKQDPQKSEFFKRRSALLAKTLEMQLYGLSAEVVFRDPAAWSTFIWVNVGEKDNEALNKRIVCKNSPVTRGSSIVGVVEWVGPRSSRVRLISDARLVPSVRAVRGEAAYLAKGELYGSSLPLWRGCHPMLKGVGFNCDVGDEDGPARDLRTGRELNSAALPLSPLEIGDTLVTTGLDGVFPAGFSVAVVSSIEPLKEGACGYELKALPSAGNLNELSFVSILPPIGFDGP